jgi:hypothetical protein
LCADLSIHHPGGVGGLVASLRNSKILAPPGQGTCRTGSPSTISPLSQKNNAATDSSLGLSQELQRSRAANSLVRGLTPPNSNSNPSSRQTISEECFLEVCINLSVHRKTLREIELAGIQSDEELFAKVRKEYFGIRKRCSTFWLLKPCGVHFVEASLNLHGNVDERLQLAD